MSRNPLLQSLASRSLPITFVPCMAFSSLTFAETDHRALALPATLVSEVAKGDDTSLSTPLPAGSRLNLSALENPASTSSKDVRHFRQRRSRLL